MSHLLVILKQAMSRPDWDVASCSKAACVPIDVLERMLSGNIIIAPSRLRGLLRLLEVSNDKITAADREAAQLANSQEIEVWTPAYIYIPPTFLPCSESARALRRAVAHVIEVAGINKSFLARMAGISRSQLYKIADTKNNRLIDNKEQLIELMQVCGLGQHGLWNIDFAWEHLRTCAANVRSAAASRQIALLTAQELEVARGVAEGMSIREIATNLFFSTRTVEYRLSSCYRKLGVRSRIELIRTLSQAAQCDNSKQTRG
jgi:DNA-binding CsgD family transcriptional regulator